MIIYCDGGSERLSKHEIGDRWILSWGFKIEHGEDGAEVCGHRFVTSFALNACHEMVAFIEAVIYADAHGSSPEETSFYTDDQVVAYGRTGGLTNFMDLNALRGSLENFFVKVAPLYSPEVLTLAREYMLRSRITWVKGHHHTVNNLRADYLACIGRQLGLGQAAQLLSFEDWLNEGVLRYINPQQPTRWYPPFADVQPQVNGV